MNQIKNGFTNHLVPNEFFLSQNYPNPFKDKTVIKYCIAYKTKVKLSVYNSEGILIETLVNKEQNAGSYEVEFSAPDKNNKSFESETYFYCFEAGSFSNTKKMTLNKNSFKEV